MEGGEEKVTKAIAYHNTGTTAQHSTAQLTTPPYTSANAHPSFHPSILPPTATATPTLTHPYLAWEVPVLARVQGPCTSWGWGTPWGQASTRLEVMWGERKERGKAGWGGVA